MSRQPPHALPQSSSHPLSRRTLLLQAAATACAASLVGQVPAAERLTEAAWASFRAGPDQRGVAPGTLPPNPQLRWEFRSPDGWVAAAAVVDDHVFAPALAGRLHCLNRLTGQEVWNYRSIDDPDPKKFAPGFKAAPLVTDSAVYIGDEDGVLHALARDSGKLLWKFTTDAEIAGCVAPWKEHLLLASHDSFLYCLTRDGKEVWKFQTNDRINCSPAIADQYTFVAGCDEHLRVIDLESGREFRDMPLESFLIASPALVGDLLYVGTHTGLIVCVDWRKGEFVWKYEGPRKMPFHASAVVTDELVVVGCHDKHVHAVERATGKPAWTFSTRAKIECSAAAVDGRCFVGSRDGNLYGLDLKTGQEIWKYNAGKDITAGIAIGEGCLVVGEDQQNGRLLCFS